MIKKLLKVFRYLLVIILLLVLMALAFTQTVIFKDILRSQIENAANSALNGTLHIGEINGNLFTNFRFEQISLTIEIRP